MHTNTSVLVWNERAFLYIVIQAGMYIFKLAFIAKKESTETTWIEWTLFAKNSPNLIN